MKGDVNCMSNLLHSFTAFNSFNSDPNFTIEPNTMGMGPSTGLGTFYSPNYIRNGFKYSEVDTIKKVINRIAVDASTVDFKHLKIDTDGNQSSVDSELIDRLTYKANRDQTGRAFIFDLVWSMLDEGVIAAVPVEANRDMRDNTNFDILELRVGKIVQWYTDSVRVRCYNSETGLDQETVLPKESVAIIESPLSEVLRSDNSTLRLLKGKTEIMRSEDSNAASGKINGFIQFPYMTNSAYRKDQADRRRQELEKEMANSKYGLATLDANEKFISTGGGVANNTLDDILKLQQDFYNQVGITENVINGTANTSELNLYYRRVVDPILQAIVDSFNMVFISKTARTQGQRLLFFRDPFRSLPVENLASTADLFSRNAILTPNEIREFIGKPPHPSPLANQLYNRNIADGNQMGGTETPGQEAPSPFPQDGNTQQEVQQITIYDNGDGTYSDENGNPVDENGNPL